MITLVGYVLQAFGMVFRKHHLFFLGHYLVGSGKTMGLPDRFRTAVWDSYHTWVREECQQTRIVINPVGHCLELYNSLGKAWVELCGDTLTLTDDYIFYPWCGNREHFANCGCKLEPWGTCSVIVPGSIRAIKFIHKLFRNKISLDFDFTVVKHKKQWKFFSERRVGNLERIRRLHRVWWSINIVADTLYIDVSDGIFAEVGKPFSIEQSWNVADLIAARDDELANDPYDIDELVSSVV